MFLFLMLWLVLREREKKFLNCHGLENVSIKTVFWIFCRGK